MKSNLSHIFLIIIFSITWSLVSAQEGRKDSRADTIRYQVDSSSMQKGKMPVLKPSDKNPVVPMPNKKPGQNEDGMPVKTLPDSTMNRPKH